MAVNISKAMWKSGCILADQMRDIGEVPKIADEDLILFDDMSNDEINDILADLGLDDI